MKKSFSLSCCAAVLLLPASLRFLTDKNLGSRGKIPGETFNTQFVCLKDTSRGIVSMHKMQERMLLPAFNVIQLPQSTQASVRTPQGRVYYHVASYPQRPGGVAVSPDGRYAYVTNQDGDKLLQYKISSNGVLQPLYPPTVETGHNPVGLILDKTGHYAYVSTDDGIDQYRINTDGKIEPLVPNSVPGGCWPSEFCFALAPDNHSLYCLSQQLGNSFNGVQLNLYHISPNGTLKNSTPHPISVGSRPTAVCVSPDGRHAYVAAFNENFVLTYIIGANGQLTQLLNARTPVSSPTGLVIAPDGRTAYAISSSDSTLFQFRIAPNGLLSALQPARLHLRYSPLSIIMDSSNKFVLLTGDHKVICLQVSRGGRLTSSYVLLHQFGYPTAVTLFKQ